jgi:Ca2+-binding EF-hand superfamily protein
MMGRKRTYITAGVLALPLLGFPNEVTAEPQWVPQSEQGRQAQSRDTMRWRAMDTNGDGRITRAEWRGNARAFDNHDWNNDGVLSGDEVRPAAARGDRAGREWTAERFDDLDRNRDGRLTRAEWQGEQASFERVDRNGDNRVTRAEFLRADTADDAASVSRFDELDANGNGRIERREWDGTREGFDWLDRNNDGSLSRAETVGNDVNAQATTFRSLDVDRSGAIEMDEWPGTRNTFAVRDRNGDWRLSEEEAGELNAAGTSGQAWTAADRVRVSAQEEWTDTGLDVRSGDLLRIRADGTIILSENDQGNDRGNAAGAFSGRRAQGALIPTANAGALIARIGDGPVFLVGSEDWAQRVSRSGRLFLGINDDHLADNRGELQVQLTIGR